MKIVWNYIFIITGVSLFLQIAGIQTGFGGIFNILGITPTPTGFSSFQFVTSIFFAAVIGILTAAGIGGAIVSLFARSPPENYIIAPFASGTAVLYISDIVSIISYGSNYGGWVSIVGLVLMTPFAVGLTAALVDYFRGGDF